MAKKVMHSKAAKDAQGMRGVKLFNQAVKNAEKQGRTAPKSAYPKGLQIKSRPNLAKK